MGCLLIRSELSRSQADHEIKSCLRDAERSLRRAADICDAEIRTNRKDGKDKSESHRAMHVQRDLEALINKTSLVGRISPLKLGDSEKPKEVTEGERNRIRREEFRKRHEERVANMEYTDGSQE